MSQRKIMALLQAGLANPGRASEYAQQILAMSAPTPVPMVDDRSQVRDRIAEKHHPPALVPSVQPTLAPSRWLELTGIGILDPQQQFNSGQMRFQFGPGFLIAFRGTAMRQTVDGGGALNGYAATLVEARLTGLQLSFNGGEPLITDGNSETWAWYSDLFGPQAMPAPMLRRVESADVLNIQILNNAPAGLATWKMLPSLMFLFLSDRDLPELLSGNEAV